MANNISVECWILLSSMLCGFWGDAHAGADPTPTDWLPQLNMVRIEGMDIVFDGGITQIRLHRSNWVSAFSSPINTMVEKQNGFAPRSTECSVPQEVLSGYKNGYGSARIIYCGLPERIWFATGGYCGEGEDDPEYNQGRLYSFSPKSGAVREYPGFLPKCAELAGLEQIGKQLLLVTVYQGEYSLGSGQVLVYDLDHVNTPAKVLTNPYPTAAVIGMSRYDKQCDCLWFSTLEGIEQLTIGTSKWEQRYLDYEISPDNKFMLTLSLKKPSDEKMWLGRILCRYPIGNVRGFVSAWNHSAPSTYDNPRIGPLMLPFYMEAIERMNEGWNDWYFAELMSVITAHQDSHSKAAARQFIERLLNQPMSLSRRKEVIASAKKFGVADAEKLESKYFDALFDDYFLRQRANGTNKNDVVDITFHQPKYLPKLRDYYLTHTITFDVEDYFLSRVKQYRSWPGYDIMAEMVDQGRKRYEYRQGLLRKCMEMRPPFSDDKLLPILQARLETDVQAKFMNDLSFNGAGSCFNASRFWFNGDEPTIRKKVALILDAAAKHKELSSVVVDILNNKFSTYFQNIDEWKRWWTYDNAKDDCSKDMTVCRFWQGSCVSMGAPQGISTCDIACQARVLSKLNAVGGITVYTHTRSAASPLDCVGFRKDLGGTEAGAKCLAKLLGYEYKAEGCNEDGFPYNVRVH